MDMTVARPARFSPTMRAVHWLTLMLITAAFGTAWTAHSGLAGEWFRPVLELHRSLGLTVLALTVFRLVCRVRTLVPELPRDLHALQKFAARATEALLYLLLLAQPVLGFLQTSARGQGVEFYFVMHLPPLLGIDRPLARQLHDWHALSANLLLLVIGMHSAAALFHHFVRRDAVLDAMLPTRLRRGGASMVKKSSASA